MINRFLDYLRYELNRAPLTIEAYRTDLEQFCKWISPKDPSEVDFISVTSSDVRAWLAARSKQGDTPRTLRRKIICLRSLFHWMMKSGIISHSPLTDLPLPKLSKPLPDLIKPVEIEEAIRSIEEDDKLPELDKALKVLVLEILYSLGIRRAELIGINDEDISFSSGELRVTGKRSKQRIVPVPQKLMAKIQEWQKLRDRESLQLEDNPLFVIKGKRITPNQVYRIVHEALGTTTARKKSPHALRHSFASAMLNGGAEIDSVREFLGHASLATTQIYTHISLNEIKKAYSNAHPRSLKESKDKDS
ncbi:MAG: tyrosine-type recombinase/integrase [Muribaculaceae bacterium]|nr:tyrosine-type recombinase/integrase [Muribaculaceae bacterium]